MKSFTLAAVTLLAATVQAHMEMFSPPPFRSKYNPNVPESAIDYSMTSPLDPSGKDYPCKLYQSDIGTPQGASVADYAPGGSYHISITGGAPHGGGSCQISFSFDGGKTFTVIQSYEGGCPLKQDWDFKVPSDVPAGAGLLAWSWHNNLGNREMYMNCASITITGSASASNSTSGTTGNSVIPPAAQSPAPAASSSSSTVAAPSATPAAASPAAAAPPASAPVAAAPSAPAAPSSGSVISGGAGCYMPPAKVKAAAAASSAAAAAPAASAGGDDNLQPPNITNLVTRADAAVAFSSRPQIFVANAGNGCTTAEGKDLKYPQPGADLVVDGDNLAGPVCNGVPSRRVKRFSA